jgi:type IV secretory pathway TrbF-like protein
MLTVTTWGKKESKSERMMKNPNRAYLHGHNWQVLKLHHLGLNPAPYSAM